MKKNREYSKSVTKTVHVLVGIMALSGLYLTSLYNYLLFHGLAEMFSIVIAVGVFMLVWNSQKINENGMVVFLGSAYLFISITDMIHTLAYGGMGVFPGYGNNLPTQLWISARYMESLTLFIAPFFIERKLRTNLLFSIYLIITLLMFGSIFYLDIFPECFIEGTGLTSFKKTSEYIISLILIGAIVSLSSQRSKLDKEVFQLLTASIILTIIAELAFTFYVSVYGLSNMIGHYCKIISYYLIYKAVIETGLKRPYDLLFRKLAQSNVRLKELDRMKSMFIASMSHELRTPLNSILGFTGVILDGMSGAVNPQQRDQLNRVQRSAQHLLAMINDIIDISIIESGRFNVSNEEFSLKELVTDAMEVIRARAEAKGLSLNFDVPPDLKIHTDRRRLLQCLLNLLTNAVKFTECGTITIVARGSNGTVEISVCDTGIGISKEDLPKVFNAFERFESRLKVKAGGTGLGLYLTNKLAREILKGNIEVESEEGKGSTFILHVPKNIDNVVVKSYV